MDLGNYKEIALFIRKLCRSMTIDDQDDLIQDVYEKLLKSGVTNTTPKNLIRRVVWQIKADRWKKKGPDITYNNEIVARATKGIDDE